MDSGGVFDESERTPSRDSRIEAVKPTGPPPMMRTATSSRFLVAAQGYAVRVRINPLLTAAIRFAHDHCRKYHQKHQYAQLVTMGPDCQ
jgi:hypothetical protein